MRALFLLTLVACAWGDYRVVTRTPEGGEVTLLGMAEAESRKKAEAYMASVCPHGHVIVDETEALVGDDSGGSKPATEDLFGHSAQRSAAASTEERRETRLRYRCNPAR